MNDRVLDDVLLRQVTPKMLNEYLHRAGWLVESEGDCAGGIKWAFDMDDVFVPVDGSRPDYVYFVDEALRQLSIVERRPEADILRDLLAGQEQEAGRGVRLLDIDPRRWSVYVTRYNDGNRRLHFVLLDAFKDKRTLCGRDWRKEGMVPVDGFQYQLQETIEWLPENHRCPECLRQLQTIAAEALRRLG